MDTFFSQTLFRVNISWYHTRNDALEWLHTLGKDTAQRVRNLMLFAPREDQSFIQTLRAGSRWMAAQNLLRVETPDIADTYTNTHHLENLLALGVTLDAISSDKAVALHIRAASLRRKTERLLALMQDKSLSKEDVERLRKMVDVGEAVVSNLDVLDDLVCMKEPLMRK
jgi:hypothetical protein